MEKQSRSFTLLVHLIALFLLCLNSLSSQAESLPVLKVYNGGRKIQDEYSLGYMTLTDTDGTSISLNAKFKTRGATAKQYSMKPSFNMKLRNGTIGRFVEVYINDQYFGIYCLTDRINRKLLNLKKVKQEEDGSITIRGVLYKHGTSDIPKQEDIGYYNDYSVYVAGYHDAWELKEPEDYASEAAWSALVNVYQNSDSYEWIKQHFYLQNLADYQLLVMALSLGDNWGNKNKFYSVRNIQKEGEDNSKVVVTPWDMDASLGGDYKGSYYGGNLNTSWTVSQVNKNMPHIIGVCFKEPEYKQLLRSRWMEARKGALSVDSVASKLRSYCELFLRTGAWERQWDYFQTQKYKPRMVEDLSKEVEDIILWYQDRFAQMDDYFSIDTGIHAVSKVRGGKYYDLHGVQREKPKKGINIIEGKKFLYR